jgi:hypothetical protein
MINYSWEFPSVECIPAESGLSDIVKVVHWRLIAIEPKTGDAVSGSNWISYRIGMSELSPADTGNFIPFNQITKENVTNWVVDKLNQIGTYSPKTDLEYFQEMLQQNIELQKNPPVIFKQLNFNIS